MRPLNAENPYFVADLDARAYMERTGTKQVHLAVVAVKNRGNGLLNERASYAAGSGVKTDVECRARCRSVKITI